MKHIITITGIRPDFIRMSKIFKKLDLYFKHTLIHTGQHYSPELSDVFFKDLDIRQPDYNWNVGVGTSDHLEQLSNLSLKIKEHQDLLKTADLILFLGDSNSVLASVPLKKMGLKIGHIEAGMRSGDKRMLEEINRVTCDHCSDFLFCYHENYAEKLRKEGITKGIHVVGNTILEVVEEVYEERFLNVPKENSQILVDIHRPENFNHPVRLNNILQYAEYYGNRFQVPVNLLAFPRTVEAIKHIKLPSNIKVIPLMGFIDYLTAAYNSTLVISDSGTAQEELAILRTPVLVPRDYTERPESYAAGCSKYLNVSTFSSARAELTCQDALDNLTFDTSWMGNGNTAKIIIAAIRKELGC